MELHVNLHGEQCHVETSGGEGWIDKDYAVGEYGFQIGDIGIYGLLPGVLVDLVIKAANPSVLPPAAPAGREQRVVGGP